jgi:hypothetical protein
MGSSKAGNGGDLIGRTGGDTNSSAGTWAREEVDRAGRNRDRTYTWPCSPRPAGPARGTWFWPGPRHGPARCCRARAGPARGTRPCLGRHPSPWHGPGTARQTGRPGARPGPLPSAPKARQAATARGQRPTPHPHAPAPPPIYKRPPRRAGAPKTLTLLIPFRISASAAPQLSSSSRSRLPTGRLKLSQSLSPLSDLDLPGPPPSATPPRRRVAVGRRRRLSSLIPYPFPSSFSLLPSPSPVNHVSPSVFM